MKYGETIFDIAYLLFAIISGIVILRKHKNDVEHMMGMAVLILGLGDACHLIPRIIDYFSNIKIEEFLGVGKLITSVTMTVFYIYIYHIYLEMVSERKRNKKVTLCIYILAIVRIVLCLLPQNKWMTNNGPLYMGIVRNIPFIAMGLIIAFLYFRDRNRNKDFKLIWIYILLSFLFYIPVVVGTEAVPMLGMLMLPKTICYVIIIYTFNKFVNKNIR